MIGNTINQYAIVFPTFLLTIGAMILILHSSTYCCKLCDVNCNCCCISAKGSPNCARESGKMLKQVSESVIGYILYFMVYAYLNLNIYAMVNFKKSWEKD